MKTPKKNRYKITYGRRQVFVPAINANEAINIARNLWNLKSATIKAEYQGHA